MIKVHHDVHLRSDSYWAEVFQICSSLQMSSAKYCFSKSSEASDVHYKHLVLHEHVHLGRKIVSVESLRFIYKMHLTCTCS